MNENNDNEGVVNQDELIMNQQRCIEKEISETRDLVSDFDTISSLDAEYDSDPVYSSKVKHLASKYNSIRRTRPDGNCFFRAFAYAYIEYLCKNSNEFKLFEEKILKSKEVLVGMGFPQFTIEDFHDTFMEALKRINPEGKIMENVLDDLHKIFNEQGYSDYIVVYLRLITSGEIEKNCDFYQNFIDGDRTVAEFRKQEVEPMYKESDHIHIIALSTCLGAGVRVEYMDRGDGNIIKAHDFPEGVKTHIYLLYRPGHYDILYPK